MVHPTAHHPDDKGSNEGAKDPATAAEETRAAHYHGCDDFQFETSSHYGGGRIDTGGLQAAAETGQETTDGVDEEDDASHGHSAQAGRFHVAADRVDVATVLGLRHEDMGSEVEENKKSHRIGDPDQGAVVEFPEAGGKLGVGDRKPPIGLLGHAPGNHHHSQRHDEGGDLAVGHQGPREKADQPRAENCDRKAGVDREVARGRRIAPGRDDPLLDEPCPHHGGEAHQAADREINPGGDDHHGHPNCHNGNDHHALSDILEVVEGEEGGLLARLRSQDRELLEHWVLLRHSLDHFHPGRARGGDGSELTALIAQFVELHPQVPGCSDGKANVSAALCFQPAGQGFGEGLEVGLVLSVDHHGLVGRNFPCDPLGHVPCAAVVGGGDFLDGQSAEEEDKGQEDQDHPVVAKLDLEGHQVSLESWHKKSPGPCGWSRFLRPA